MKSLRLNISPCPNDTFMFDALINGRIDTYPFNVEVEYHDIEQLNQRVLDGRADISKISCAVLPQIADKYTLLDSGAALGRGNGPLLVCRKGDPHTPQNIAIPGTHTTAAALIQKLCPSISKATPLLFSEIAEAVENGTFDGGVLIHEGRFVYQQRNLELIADLGQLWEQTTNLPLPLGCIVMLKSFEPELREEFNAIIRQSIEYAFANPTASRNFIKSHAQELSDSVIDNHIDLFVNNFSLDLGDEGHKAIHTLTHNKPQDTK